MVITVKDKGLFVRVKGVPSIVRTLGKITNEATRELALRMVEVVEKVGGSAKKYAPVDTGYLKANIKGSVSRNRTLVLGRVKSSAHYSIYQEFGSMGRAAHPYMMPAYNENKRFILEKLSEGVTSAVFRVTSTNRTRK